MNSAKIIKNPLPLKLFKDISKIPRNSGDEKAISDFLIQFAQSYNLEFKRDDHLNVLINKPGQNGGENSNPVVLQAHMDMVYVKRPESQHQYNSPLNICQSEGIIKALGTSLGADNGIGMSYILAILASDDIRHPPIEALFTTAEEDGLIGASKLQNNWLTGETLINLDGEDESVLLIGSAGGLISSIEVEINRKNINSDWTSFIVRVDGINGGHSGIEIGSGRANAIKVMGRVLYYIGKKINILIESIDGGERDNVIPYYCEAKIFIEEKNEDNLNETITNWNKLLKNEFAITDRNIKINIRKVLEKQYLPLSKNDTDKIIRTLILSPDGIQVMSKEVKDHVQTSINLGVIKTSDKVVTLISNARSSVESQKECLSCQLQALSEQIDSKYLINTSYPAWQIEKISPIRELCIEEYERLFGKSPKIELIHGGLECGYFKEKYPDLDIISIGPSIHDVHSVSEWVEVDSVIKVWKFLKNILAKL